MTADATIQIRRIKNFCVAESARDADTKARARRAAEQIDRLCHHASLLSRKRVDL